MNKQKRFEFWHYVVAIGLLFVAVLCFWTVVHDPLPETSSGNHSTPGEEISREALRTQAASLHQRINSADIGDFPELMGVILRVGDPRRQSDLIASILQRWLIEDLDSFIAFLDEADVDGLEVWDAIAPGSVAAARTIKDSILKSNTLAQVIERILLNAAESDPESALAWARELLPKERFDSAIVGIAPELAAVNPEAAIDLLDEVRAFASQMQAAADVGFVLGGSGFDLALTWAESFHFETERSFALSGVLRGLAGRNASQAAEEYSRVVEAMKRGYQDQIQEDRAKFGDLGEDEFEGLSAEEIEETEMARPNPNLVYLQNATRAIALELARENPSSALGWAESMDLHQGKAVALETIYEVWGSVDPHAAFQHLLQQSDRRPEYADRLFRSWATENPDIALAAVQTLKPGFERDSAIEGVADGWIDSGGNPSEVAQWADELQEISESDRVRAIVASAAAFDDPILALKQVERISNPLKRSELFQEVFPSLLAINPSLARDTLSTIKLSDVEIEYFEHMLGP